MTIVKKSFGLKEVSSNMKESKSLPCLSNYFNKSLKSAKLAVKSFSMNVQYVFSRVFKNLEFFFSCCFDIHFYKNKLYKSSAAEIGKKMRTN